MRATAKNAQELRLKVRKLSIFFSFLFVYLNAMHTSARRTSHAIALTILISAIKLPTNRMYWFNYLKEMPRDTELFIQ